jgi:hypothetical protein
MREQIYDDTLHLLPEREVTPDGRIKDDVRAAIIEGYAMGIYTGEECFNFFDADHLWPPHKGEFWAIFFEGLRSFRSREDAPERPEAYPSQPHYSNLERSSYRLGGEI